MKHILKKLMIVAGILLYILFGILFVNESTRWMAEEYYKTLGSKAMDIALIVSKSYYLTDQEVAELRSLPFKEIVNHPANQRLSKLFAGGKFNNDFKYAYIMVRLNKDEIKYRVDQGHEEYYKAPAGTALDVLWLVDVIINSEEKNAASKQSTYYDDINRYSYIREYDMQVFEDKKSTYVISRDEYGNAFTGYVPFYTDENHFVGMLGVDIYFERFEQHTNEIRIVLLSVFLFPTIILTAVYTFFYVRKQRYNTSVAYNDSLTGLYNRRFLSYCLPRLLREHFRKRNFLSVIMVDVDYFKKYNDYYGHQKGDIVLYQVSQAILSVLRSNTDYVCRYGGEEIILLLPNTNLQGARAVAKKVKQAVEVLSIPHIVSEVSATVSVSQGIYSAIPRALGKEAEHKFIEHADQALYRAKERGRNSYVSYEE